MKPQVGHAGQLQLGPQGRIVIPADIRRQLGLAPGDTLIARIEDDRLVIEKPDAIVRRLRARFAALPAGTDLAAELIAERRLEGSREA